MTQAYPLQWPAGWPRTVNYHRRMVLGSYDAQNVPWDRLMKRLSAAVEGIGAKNAVLSTNLETRLDGYPRADRAAPADPGVAVYFTRNDRNFVLAQDGYANIRDNVRSIAIALEHLRGLERHGGKHLMERAFTGFEALPPPGGAAVRPWRKVLNVAEAAKLAEIEAAYRELAKRAHPDIPGGSEGMMAELNAAISAARKEMGA